jgi:hypothetical protein
LVYSPSDSGIVWQFADPCPDGRPVLFRDAVGDDGEVCEVRSVSAKSLQCGQMSAVCISRHVARLGEKCLFGCHYIANVAFESDSHLREFGTSAFYFCDSLQSIAVPSCVELLGPTCFRSCWSFESVTFERPSKLAKIESRAFWYCLLLNRLFIPASVTAIAESAFTGSGIESLEIEDGSVSFRVVNALVVDFEVRSRVWVIGRGESIEIPSSIEELRRICCS